MKALQIIALLILSVSAFAQNKIAMIDTKVFADKNLGIKKYILAWTDYNSKLSEIKQNYERNYYALIKKRAEIDKKLQKLAKSKKSTDEAILQRIKVNRENRDAQQGYGQSNMNLMRQILGPVDQQIRDKLGVYLGQKGYTDVISLQEIKAGRTVNYSDAIDVTTEFIKFCNEEFEREKLAK